MFAEETSGVEESLPVAGVEESESIDYEKLLFSDDEPGVEEESAADSLPEEAEKAFAKRLKAEREKIEREVREQITAETKNVQTENVYQQSPTTFKPLSGEELEAMAEKLGATPELVNIIYNQEQMNRQLHEHMRKREKIEQERREYDQAVAYAKALKEKHPTVPEWNDDMVHKYRMQFYRDYGRTIPWREAYKAVITDSVLTGDMERNTEQEVLRKVTERDSANVTISKPQQKKLGMWDLTPSQFAEVKERALEGKFKKS